MRRGFTLIEAMVAMVVLTIGMLGLATTQVIGVKAASMGASMQKATALGMDLMANIQQWDYNDARLATTRPTLTTMTDPAVLTAATDTNRAATPSPTPDFGEPATGATTNSALTLNGAVYSGVTYATIAGNTKTIYRYWNVFPVILAGSGAGGTQGKLIQVLVRWTEQGLTSLDGNNAAGYRQLVFSTYKANPSAATQ